MNDATQTRADLISAHLQLERSDDVDDDPAQLVHRVTLIGRAVDDALSALERIHRRLVALEQSSDES